MVTDPELIKYVCIARATTVLAHRRATTADPAVESLASECIALAPPNHSFFTQTLKRRTYTFLMDPPFVFFAIFDHRLIKPFQLRFLHRLRDSSSAFLRSQSPTKDDDFVPFCFQSQFDSIFGETLNFESEGFLSRIPSVDSPSAAASANKIGRSSSTVPLLGKPQEGVLKKKKRAVEAVNGEVKDGGGSPENKVDMCNDEFNGGGGTRDFSVAVAAKGGGCVGNDHHRQKAKHIWKKHVWVVLLLDLSVCVVLFVIWLWVCSGFKCMTY
ncbi:hypothetical protein PIB30_008369 [Stylosanthes scabra]|uniref:Phytolongin Phyl2.2 n=1 Tax=Stylosanthes scabra TaxID=79078 RepID=A0ABU6U566_9FABA|nr:hypothetical protein [Stylosanthes scabra]